MVSTSTPASTPTKFECRVGLTQVDGATAIWIESPRTRNRLTVDYAMLKQSSNGLGSGDPIVRRIVQAASVGRHVVSFTRDELQFVKDQHADIEYWKRPAHLEPVQQYVNGLWGGWKRPRRR